MIFFVDNYQGALKTKKAALRHQDEEFNQKQRHRRILRQEFDLFISSMFFLGLIFFLGVAVGAIAGINIPDGAACTQGNVPCKSLRIRHPKTVF